MLSFEASKFIQLKINNLHNYQVRSIQATVSAVTINHWRHTSDDVTEDDLNSAADAVMLEDVIKRQKLEAEISEAEEAIKQFQSQDHGENDEKETSEASESQSGDGEEGLDLTPSLSGAQTLSLSSSGDWVSQGVSDSVPLPSQPSDHTLPPPPPPCRNFHHRFLEGRSSSSDAVKELQKLRWTNIK